MHGEGQLWKLFHQTFLRMRGDGTEWIFLSIVMDIALYYRLIMKQFIYMSEPSSSWLWSENQIFTYPQIKRRFIIIDDKSEPKCHYFYSSWTFIQMQQRRERSNNFCLLYMIMVKARRVLPVLKFLAFRPITCFYGSRIWASDAGALSAASERKNMISLLHEYVDVFAYS